MQHHPALAHDVSFVVLSLLLYLQSCMHVSLLPPDCMQKTCALSRRYGEHKVLRDPDALLMDMFPRICFTHGPKVLLQYPLTNPNMPHDAPCKSDKDASWSVDQPEFKDFMKSYVVHYIHY